MKLIWLIVFLMTTVGCLQTRGELAGSDNTGAMAEEPPSEEREPGRYVAGTLNQQQRAQIDSRFYEIDRDFRQLYGKIEVLEKQINDRSGNVTATATDPEAGKKVKELEERVATLEEAVLSLDKKLSGLGKTTQNSTTKKKADSPFALAEHYFANHDYENAVQSYETYRRHWPKGKRYADSTFKMGECFRKLKMDRDAKAFYQEVVTRFPKSAIAKNAQERLKSIQ